MTFPRRRRPGFTLASHLASKRRPLNVDEDFTTQPDGAMGTNWSGATWLIASGRLLNTPTPGSELLTDPGLEANYTLGKCDTLTVNGVPLLVQSADAHGGSKAQQFTAIALNGSVRWANANATARQWYQYSIWGKRTVGIGGTVRAQVSIPNGLPTADRTMAITDAAYTQKKTALLATDTSAMSRYAVLESGSSLFDTVIVDDGSFKALTFSTLPALYRATQVNVIVKCVPQTPLLDDTQIGLMARADAQSSPTHFILALLQRHPTSATSATVYLLKKVSNTYTLITSGGITLASGAYLEIRCSGSTIKIYYNNAQVGTDQTISDAEILNNTYHGVFSTGDNKLQSFALQAN